MMFCARHLKRKLTQKSSRTKEMSRSETRMIVKVNSLAAQDQSQQQAEEQSQQQVRQEQSQQQARQPKDHDRDKAKYEEKKQYRRKLQSASPEASEERCRCPGGAMGAELQRQTSTSKSWSTRRSSRQLRNSDTESPSRLTRS